NITNMSNHKNKGSKYKKKDRGKPLLESDDSEDIGIKVANHDDPPKENNSKKKKFLKKIIISSDSDSDSNFSSDSYITEDSGKSSETPENSSTGESSDSEFELNISETWVDSPATNVGKKNTNLISTDPDRKPGK